MLFRSLLLIAMACLAGAPAVAASKRHVPVPKAKPAIASAAAAESMTPIVPAVLPVAPAKVIAGPAPAFLSAAPVPAQFSKEQVALYRAGFAAVDAGHQGKFNEVLQQGGSEIGNKLLTWYWISRPGTNAPFDRIADFIAKNKDWPGQDTLARRAEDALSDDPSDARVLAWFAHREPVIGVGQMRLAEALLRTGKIEEGTARLRRAWIEGNFSAKDEARILKLHKGQIRAADNAARLDRLLWNQETGAAKRMLRLVSPDVRALSEARLALGELGGGVERLIRQVPSGLQDDPGLSYDRVRWRRLRGHDDQALELLLSPQAKGGDADKWWIERRIQARRSLAGGNISEAYRLAANHGQTSDKHSAEAEWLAGWIALRFLEEKHTALQHFLKLYGAVRTPISKARAAYWAGRAAEAIGDKAGAERWYREAAENTTTYYGQLAALKLGRRAGLALPPEPRPSAAVAEAFANKELVRAVYALAELGQQDRMRLFILRLNDLARSAPEHQLVADLAERVGRVDLGVASAKRSAQNGFTIVNRSFPLVDMPESPSGPETSLLLAVSRQESEFNPEAVSNAGARGLMQLMPATAKMLAKMLQLNYRPELLTADPAYNARLGGRYLGNLLDNYDGNYVLALAAYNAGDSRVHKWIRDWGDPRRSEVDAIDWIELIPFSETRNYVQRVLESVQVYRQRLNPRATVALQLEDDLRGRPRKHSCNC